MGGHIFHGAEEGFLQEVVGVVVVAADPVRRTALHLGGRGFEGFSNVDRLHARGQTLAPETRQE